MMTRSVARYVVYEWQMGIYLGSFLGLQFWSRLDPVGQQSAYTFRFECDAVAFCNEVQGQGFKEAIVKAVVLTEPDRVGEEVYMTPSDAELNGLPRWTP